MSACYHCAKIGWNWCSSFDNMQVLIFNEFGFKIAYSGPKMGVWGNLIPWGVASSRLPKGTCLRWNSHTTIDCYDQSTVHLLPNSQSSMLYNAFQSAGHHKSSPSRGGICTLPNTWFLGPTRLSIPNGTSIGVGRQPFCTAHDRDRPTDRPIDHATPSVTIGYIYVPLWCGLMKMLQLGLAIGLSILFDIGSNTEY